MRREGAGGQGRPGGGGDQTLVRFLGHSTVAVETAGVVLLTDPLLRGRVAHLGRRRAAPRPGRIPPPDAVLISHAHHDHLDPSSLRLLGEGVRLVVPAGAGEWLRQHGFRAVEEVVAGEAVEVGPVRVVATPASHDGFRAPFGPRATCLGFCLEAPAGHRLYFAGDTDLFPGMRALGPVDLALIPVWGWGPRLGPGHLDPYRAAQAVARIRPALAVPIHWGTLHVMGLGHWNGRYLTHPPLEFAAHAARLAPETEVVVVPPGEALALPPPRAPR